MIGIRGNMQQEEARSPAQSEECHFVTMSTNPTTKLALGCLTESGDLRE